MESQSSAGEAPQRRRLNLKPRDPAAAAAADAERASGKSNPFGAAKPREAVLAAKAGKSEEELIKEEAAKQRLNLRLEREERERKETAEEQIEELRTVLKEEQEPERRKELEAELSSKQDDFEKMMKSFETTALDRAKTGGGMRPSERRALAEERRMVSGGLDPAGSQDDAAFANFGRAGSGRAPPGQSYGGSFGSEGYGGAPPGNYAGGYQDGGGGGGRGGGRGGRGGGYGGPPGDYANFSQDRF